MLLLLACSDRVCGDADAGLTDRDQVPELEAEWAGADVFDVDVETEDGSAMFSDLGESGWLWSFHTTLTREGDYDARRFLAGAFVSSDPVLPEGVSPVEGADSAMPDRVCLFWGALDAAVGDGMEKLCAGVWLAGEVLVVDPEEGLEAEPCVDTWACETSGVYLWPSGRSLEALPQVDFDDTIIGAVAEFDALQEGPALYGFGLLQAVAEIDPVGPHSELCWVAMDEGAPDADGDAFYWIRGFLADD